MERREKTVLTNMCMICDGSRVLVEDKIWRDLRGIIFPGGHVEENEPIVDSVIREVREETGLTIENPKLCGIKDWFEEDGARYLVFLFKADRFSGELRSSEEGRVFWAEEKDLPDMPLLWNMGEMMRIFSTGEFAELFLDSGDDWKPVLK